MSADNRRHEIATRRVIYEVATDGVTVKRNLPYELGRKTVSYSTSTFPLALLTNQQIRYCCS